MRIGTLLLATVVSATLVGCASMHPRDMHPDLSKAKKCNMATCDLQVTVKENSDGTCDPVVDDLQFTGAERDRSVVWTIAGPYEFSKESYKFALFVKDNPGDQFRGASTSGRTLTLKFVHTPTPVPKKYAYVLAVRRTNGTFCRTLDPWLIS
jgi:hypothetical protein